MRSIVRMLALLAIPALLAGCSDAGPTEPTSQLAPGSGPAALTAGFPMYGIGALKAATPGSPCSAAAHRDFDFWLGNWDVYDPAGQQVGTNAVTSELDGCVVAEHWTDSDGGRGRSINTYDAETGQWHQTWISAYFSGHTRMAGGLDEDGRMVLNGHRVNINTGFTLYDEYIWTVLSPDRVKQEGFLRVPAVGYEGSFVGIYERRDEITPAPEVPTAGCQPGGATEEARQLDFWLGDWVVTTASGEVLGTSTVSTDLSGCLLEERFETSKGYQAVSFAAFDYWEKQWYRTYIDNRGEQVRLNGTFDGDAVTLTGVEGGPGESGDLLQRATITPTDGGVHQSLDVSRDGGDSWKHAVDLIYRPAGGSGPTD